MQKRGLGQELKVPDQVLQGINEQMTTFKKLLALDLTAEANPANAAQLPEHLKRAQATMTPVVKNLYDLMAAAHRSGIALSPETVPELKNMAIRVPGNERSVHVHDMLQRNFEAYHPRAERPDQAGLEALKQVRENPAFSASGRDDFDPVLTAALKRQSGEKGV